MKFPIRRILSYIKGVQLKRLDAHGYQVVQQVRAEKLTYLDMLALVDLYKTVKDLEQEDKPGLIIEAGCALGGSAVVMTAAKSSWRPLQVYDVFGMIPPPSDQDGQDAHDRYKVISSGISDGIKGDRYYGYQENLLGTVEGNFQRYGYPVNKNNITLVKGLFESTMHISEPIALAHIDADWYDSVMTCLERITPWLISGGRIIIDDYDDWSGCRKAVNNYFHGKDREFSFIMKSRLQITRFSGGPAI